MEAWLAILVVLIPPAVLAALPPRTEKWRRARKLFWRTTALGIATLAATLAVIEFVGRGAFFLGPALLWIGALVLNVVVLAVWCFATGELRSEWSKWREQRKTKETTVEVPVPDPTKPWKV